MAASQLPAQTFAFRRAPSFLASQLAAVDDDADFCENLWQRLLRVLEDGSMRRVGSLRERRVDVRLITATNRNLAEEVRANRFR